MPQSRSEKLAAIKQKKRYSVVIVGAGINGAGVFRDLALQGVDCLLIDKADYCSGTSAAPSRLIHGGLKYLETGEFRLVAESAAERNLLLRNAPHVVHPLKVVVPVFSWLGGIITAIKTFLGLKGKPSDRGGLIVKLGLMMYDWYGRRHQVMPKHELILRNKSLEELPDLAPDIVATGRYYDAYVTQAERLAYELIEDGRAANPESSALNYAKLSGQGARTILIEDQLSGERFEVEPTILINAAGPWIDLANAALGETTRYIGGTKGSHVLLTNPHLVAQLNNQMVFFGTTDGRLCLAYPFLGQLLVGSTDIPISNPDDAHVDETEIDYMLGELKKLFPSADIDKRQVVYKYTGVRPLPTSNVDNPGQISRDHSIRVNEATSGRAFPILSLVGGKWTTFRAFAEQTTDRVLEHLRQSRSTTTRHLAIGGGKNYPKSSSARTEWIRLTSQKTGLNEKRIEQLLVRYGTTAAKVAEFIANAVDTPINDLEMYSVREIQFLVQRDDISHLDDLLFRRTPMALSGQLSASVISVMADIVGEGLQWTKNQREQEIERTVHIAHHVHGIPLGEDIASR